MGLPALPAVTVFHFVLMTALAGQGPVDRGSRENQADGGGGGDVAGGPVGGWLGVIQLIRAETGAIGLLKTAIAKQNIARPRSVSG